MKSGYYQVQLTDSRVLASGILYRRGPLFRMKGLLGRKELAPGEGIFLVPCNSIHMFFMSFPIDVLFLDRNFHILKIYNSIPPWRVTPVIWGAWAALEIEEGRCREYSLEPGMKLHLVDAITQ